MHGLHKLLLFNVLACLGRNLSVMTIMCGEEDSTYSMLYMASIQNDNRQHVCGGFRISDDFVVTAARCDIFLQNLRTASVVLSTQRLNVNLKTEKYIAKKCKHPSYVDVTTGNDIMLLKMAGREGINIDITTIQLTENKVKENKKCRVAGWGCTEPGGTTVNDLRVADVSIKRKWSGRSADAICAGGFCTMQTLCKGDFGGPLVCDGKAAGVASYNKCGNCNNRCEPSIYTDISKFLPWINKVVVNNDWTDCKK